MDGVSVPSVPAAPGESEESSTDNGDYEGGDTSH
jgi:hypothetical protein